VFLSGFTESEEQILKKAILLADGTRFTEYSPEVTHFVTKNHILNNAEKALIDGTHPMILRHNWLLECFKSQSLIGTQDFLIADDLSVLKDISNLKAEEDNVSLDTENVSVKVQLKKFPKSKSKYDSASQIVLNSRSKSKEEPPSSILSDIFKGFSFSIMGFPPRKVRL
jgi:hypothetical protein